MLKSLPFIGYWQKTTFTLWLIAALCFYFADTEIISLDPWSEFRLMAEGFLRPDFFATEYLLEALWQTVSFALLGVVFGLLWGAPLALIYSNRFVAMLCAITRSIHEIFWALLFLQIFGLSPITGILAIGLPYGATFARVFHDILLQSPKTTVQTLPYGTDKVSRYFYGRISHVLVPIMAYIRYRFECALRSSAVLGFIGMPTLGFYLETAFRQGHYHEGAALLMLFIALIGTISLWCRPRLIALYFVVALFTLPSIPPVEGALLWRFITQDILPPALQNLSTWSQVDLGIMQSLSNWSLDLLVEQALPGMIVTLLLALVSLAMAHGVAVVGSGLASNLLTGKVISRVIHLCLLVLRSVPEYIFAFLFMMLLGPSMLPAMLALALHNGALIAYLTVRQSDTTQVSPHYNGRIDGYCYDLLPQIYPNLMGLLFYRFEVILRETAIFGILGIASLGFYIDSGFSEIRYSSALFLMGCTALLNIVVDIISRRLLTANTGTQISCARESAIRSVK
ncbi:binding-protein-dependent transport systems inner membrane component [Shewanella sediminis HAW-EB3]|uniref:Binding-protein-dependent transport systems inner membrane component n=1 Tax=Shewanella sediminis (strain HAW-EB3) TaxID=425104 RepID=A8FU82_SHESH|nr:ABC transporter permease [Shewanella sediminis]ABV36405.1 binding-protein-dependent transport systems inner membrane component [Shewanella sediminis HAW-EB3]